MGGRGFFRRLLDREPVVATAIAVGAVGLLFPPSSYHCGGPWGIIRISLMGHCAPPQAQLDLGGAGGRQCHVLQGGVGETNF